MNGEAVERNLTEWTLAKAQAVPGVEIHRDGDVCWTYTAESLPGNTVCGARFTDGVAARSRAKRILDYHLERKAACHWITGPASRPADLEAAIRSLGFSCRIRCAGMSCDLSRRTRADAVAGVEIRLEAEPFLLDPVTTPRRRRALAIRRGMPRYWMYGARIDGKPVGHTVLFGGESEAGIYDVEVAREARGRGVAARLVSMALDHAAELGYSHAVLAATGAGKGVYERVGFAEVGMIGFWMYGKMRQE